MDVLLRSASPTDAEEVARVYVASWNEGFAGLLPPRALDTEQVARWSRDLDVGSVQWRVAETNGAVVGFFGAGPSRDPVDPQLGELDTIAVAPSWWRQGIGRHLMSAAIEVLQDMGYRRAILWTLADYGPGRDFYAATGWFPSGDVRDAGRQVAFRRSLVE